MVKNRQNQPGNQAFWQQHSLAWERSNISQREYCRQHKLRLSTFGYWRRKLSHCAQTEDFVKISAGTPQVSELDLVIGDEVLIRIKNQFDPELLIKVVRVVRRAL